MGREIDNCCMHYLDIKHWDQISSLILTAAPTDCESLGTRHLNFLLQYHFNVFLFFVL
uniref:Uncharacterized protein n=1 Tax=Oryza brachyantha TaxID=4533 RepID=J3KU10_ORYBR